ncbi:hypothetical protein EIQ01_21460 [Xanthomonas campestris pv. raphani]
MATSRGVELLHRGRTLWSTRMIEEDALKLTKLRAEIRKLNRESDKLMLETRWYPMVVTTALFAAVAAVIKLFG